MQDRLPRLLTFAFCLLALGAAQSRPAPTGTASISGVVVSDDATASPIRRAIVTIAGNEIAQNRSTITDDRGQFSLPNLPAGRFTITSRKPSYLPGAYGATRPGRPGTELLLGAGEQARISIAMTRGGVLAGLLRSPQGRPWRDLVVAVINVKTGTLQSTPGLPASQTTDDRGAYRFYGLPPGEYVVVAAPRSDGRGEIGARSSSEMDTLLADLERRSGRGTVTTPRPVAPPPLPAPVNYAPIYYPGSPIYSNAATIKLNAGEERTGLDFTVMPVPAVSIEGVVVAENGQPPASVTLSIYGAAPRISMVSGSSPVLTQPPGPDGRFKYTNVPPDHYTIIARSSTVATTPPTGTTVGVAGGGSGTGLGLPPTPSGRYGYSIVEVDANASDISGLTLTLHQGATLKGKLEFEGTLAPPGDLTTVRVGLRAMGQSWSSMSYGTAMGPALAAVPPFSVQADGTFLATNIAPGSYQFSITLPADAPGWWLRSAMVGDRDAADVPLVVKTSDPMETTIHYTDRRTEILGTLQNTGGRPAPEYFVLVFTTDRAQWRAGSRRIQTARPGTDGRFSIRDLPPGDYILVALTDLAPGESTDPAFLEQLTGAGTRLSLVEGERKLQDYRIGK